MVLSFASFLPQLQLLWLRRDSSGVSLYYVLFNLVVSTEIFTIDLAILNSVDGGNIFVHAPATIGDWLNLAQFGTVWVMWVVMYVNPSFDTERIHEFAVVKSLIKSCPLSFITCIVFYPRGRPRTVPVSASAIYICYLLISLLPIIVVSTRPGPKEDRKWFDGLFTGFHILFLNPPITILGVASLYPQCRAILRRPRDSGPGALSLVGLAAQAVLFLILGFTWLGRLAWPYPAFWRAFRSWFKMVGYVPFDYITFAGVQAILLYIAVRHNGWHAMVEGAHPASERDPLL